MRRHKHEEHLNEIASIWMIFERLSILTDKFFMDQMLYWSEKACTALKLILLWIVFIIVTIKLECL